MAFVRLIPAGLLFGMAGVVGSDGSLKRAIAVCVLALAGLIAWEVANE